MGCWACVPGHCQALGYPPVAHDLHGTGSPELLEPPCSRGGAGRSVRAARRASRCRPRQSGTAFRDEYPDVEEHPARPPMAVEAGGLEVSVDLLSGFEKPNLWFVKDGGDRLVQFQHDRLVVNWRRRPGEQYPRYENAVRPMFEDAWRRLASVLGALDLGPLRPNMCEAIYINLVDSGGAWTGHSETDRVLAPWSGRHSDGFLPPAAEVRLGARYALPDRRGWLVVDGIRTPTASDGRPALMLQLAGRGRAWSPDLAGVLEFFDLPHEWIVRGFVSFTEAEMHREWGLHE